MRSMRLNAFLVLVATACPAALGQNYDWLNAALPERAYDFGVVARGSQLRHAFPVVNRGDQEIRILEWRTKCGCTDVKVGAKVIPPGTQTTVEVTVDTTRFLGHKPSGLTLIFETPSYVQVDLNTSCFIRGDIVTTPGQLDFGIVRRSDKAASAALTLTYAGGRADWAVTSMGTQSDKIKAECRETGRSADGQIVFALSATLSPSVPNGYFKDEVTVETNDGQKIPISVVANVQGAVALTPSIINFGQIKPGQSVTKTVLVRSDKPFSITNLTTTKDDLQTEDQAKGSQPVHQVKLTLKAPEQAGAFHSLMTVKTDIPDEPEAVLKTFATVGP
ncbi:DUF1573 domain-containing protein [Paludisphaera mucosa]|uniref:DUF1573 domain-containing protein n=1 Tax=Paludisphaera mucosa TaxID=3030827 RepID=A0ABT6F5S7_9BACT|nr:DUF1573 domain-containing protein [Paludisphaera mucosa]MDG3002930.1 DUF1573 domain-containing protein [Paludisphaera mucosa]